jgi:flagellar motor component MotA
VGIPEGGLRRVIGEIRLCSLHSLHSLQRKEYLGFIINKNRMIVEVPGPKLARIRKILGDFLKTRRHKVQDIASVVEKLVSLEPALGRLILVGTRLATIAIVATTEVSDAVKKRFSPWS